MIKESINLNFRQNLSVDKYLYWIHNCLNAYNYDKKTSDINFLNIRERERERDKQTEKFAVWDIKIDILKRWKKRESKALDLELL